MELRGPYLQHLRNTASLCTTYEAKRKGFIELALEKNRRGTPFVNEGRSLKSTASQAHSPNELLSIPAIRNGLLKAAGVSDKAENHLSEQDMENAIVEFIKEFLEPAGEHFVEELVYRFLLTKGDALGGMMRNIEGAWAQKKLADAIFAALNITGIRYSVLLKSTPHWFPVVDSSIDTMNVKGVRWIKDDTPKTIFFNIKVPFVGDKGNNIDICVFNRLLDKPAKEIIQVKDIYLALGELKGGIDPAGADEHWKTANSALSRIREAFGDASVVPKLFFVGAAIEQSMANEIWAQLEKGELHNAGNMTNFDHLNAICRWLIEL